MNIEELILNGADEKEVQAALEAVRAKKRKQDEERRNAAKTKERYAKDARAYLVNAVIAYSYVFDLLQMGEEWTDEEVEDLEAAVIEVEESIPFLLKLFNIGADLG